MFANAYPEFEKVHSCSIALTITKLLTDLILQHRNSNSTNRTFASPHLAYPQVGPELAVARNDINKNLGPARSPSTSKLVPESKPRPTNSVKKDDELRSTEVSILYDSVSSSKADPLLVS